MHIVLDLDNTLICTLSEMDENNPNIHYLGIIEGKVDIICLRPHAFEFLDFCKKNFESIMMCSYSSRYRVSRCIQATGIDRYLTEYFGGDDIDKRNGIGPRLDNFILIDDYDWYKDLIKIKIGFFGFSGNSSCKEEVAKYHIQASRFLGDGEDTQLLDMIKVLKGRLKQGQKKINA